MDELAADQSALTKLTIISLHPLLPNVHPIDSALPDIPYTPDATRVTSRAVEVTATPAPRAPSAIQHAPRFDVVILVPLFPAARAASIHRSSSTSS